MRPLPIAAMADVPPFVLGVSVIRGTTTPVVDTGILLGLIEPPAPERFVTLRAGKGVVAIAVEGVVGIHQIAAPTLTKLPPLLESESDLVDAIGIRDRELLLVLQAARIFSESTWQAIALGQAP